MTDDATLLLIELWGGRWRSNGATAEAREQLAFACGQALGLIECGRYRSAARVLTNASGHARHVGAYRLLVATVNACLVV